MSRRKAKILPFRRKAKLEVITSQEKYTALVNEVFDPSKYWSHWCENPSGMRGLVGSVDDTCPFCGKTRQQTKHED